MRLVCDEVGSAVGELGKQVCRDVVVAVLVASSAVREVAAAVLRSQPVRRSFCFGAHLTQPAGNTRTSLVPRFLKARYWVGGSTRAFACMTCT